MMSPKIAKALLLAAIFFTGSVSASYHWVDANDLHLRADIQLLADVGIVKVPTTTYPLMWSGVIDGINSAEIEELSPLAKEAYYRVLQNYNKLRKSSSRTTVSVAAANRAARLQHYGSPTREQGAVSLQQMGESEYFFYNLEAGYVYDPDDQEEFRLDGSYISLPLGNWMVNIGRYGEWYGQGWDTALIKSTNARPLPSFSIMRNRADPFSLPVLSWLGPWTLSTGISLMDDDNYRAIENPLLWSFRASIKPHPNFEFGVSRTAQLCGQGKSCGLGEWKNMLIGETNVWSGENPANQLAAVDMRWGATFYDIPYGIYWESMGEDAVRLDRFPPFQAKSYLMGVDLSYHIKQQSIRSFFEYSETNADCKSDGNCTYEHSTYLGGYRYSGRSIGSTYDNDAKTYTLGFIGHTPNQHQWKSNLRYLDLNMDNTNRIFPGGNTVAPIAEQALQVDFSYLWPLFSGDIEVGGSYTYSTYTDNIAEDKQLDLWAKWRYSFSGG